MSDSEEPVAGETIAPDPEPIEDAESEANKIRERATDAERRRESRAAANARFDALGALSGLSLNANTVIFGDAQVGTLIGRDSYRGGSGVGFERSGRVEPRRLHDLDQIFVPPPKFEQLCDRLGAQSVLLLRAPRGWGRTATALRALSRQCASGVHKLSPDVELRSLDLEFDHCTGYLFDTPDSQQLRTLSEFHLEQLGRRLVEVESRLIVVVDDQAEVSPDVGAFVHDVGEPADVTAILRKHLRQQLADDDLGVLSRLEVTALLSLVTEHRPSAHELVNLAALLVDVAADRIDIAEVVSRYVAAEDNRFRQWFDELDTDTRPFAIALAVFNNMPLHIVSEAGRALASSIVDAEVLGEGARSGQTVFGVRSAELMSRAQAQSYRSHEDTLYGRITVDAVRFVDERFPQRLLEYIWQEYSAAHQVVRDWLRELGGADDLRVSTRAGVAVGLLSTFEFEYARRLVIEPWADSGQRHDQYAAIGALQFSSLQPELAPLVAEMLEAWVQPTQPMARRVTATAALGSTVGQLMPDRALRLLRRSARSSDPDLRDAVCYSMIELFSSRELDVRVLRDLRRWTVSRRRGVRYTGFLCILQLSFDLVAETVGGVQPWPRLVWLADQSDEHRDHIVVLFARLMQAPYYPPAAYAEIKRWVHVAERDPQFRGPLGRLLVDLETADQNNGMVPFHLREWAGEDGGPRAAVDELLTMLDAKQGV
ncbi:hypothetical protein [Nocardia sp. NPDC051463]|uniref:hypothetical protein n=1 Tax=Nocardia sp. NPDC051463 TaxID=3154845 RepID=UPI00341C13B2